jgi:hypothetical protein
MASSPPCTRTYECAQQLLQGLLLGVGDSNTVLESAISPLSTNGGSAEGSFSGRRRFIHSLIQNPDKDENKRGKKRRCQMCKKDTRWMCDHPICRARIHTRGNNPFYGSFFCQPCFRKHQQQVAQFEEAQEE